MKDVIQHLNILKSHKSETYSVNDGRVKVTGKPSKYFSLTLFVDGLDGAHVVRTVVSRTVMKIFFIFIIL